MKIKFLDQNEKKIYIFLIFIIFVSYFIGFYFQENSAGGAIVDFENTKRNLLTFKNNSFFDAIKATTSKDPEIFRSTRAPGFYVFNKYLNPFVLDFRLHQLFISFISLFIVFFLFLNLKIKFNKENNYVLLFLSSIVLLSPYLRSSAYWGNEENLGILIASISSLFFQLYFKELSRTKELYNLILMALFSSLVVYCDQKLIIVPLFFLISILFSKKNIKDKIFLIILYLIFSIPFLFLIKLWGGIVPTADGLNRKINFNIYSLNYHYFLFSISIISFYLFPFSFFLNERKKNILRLIKLKENYFISAIFLIALTYFLFFFNFENFYYLGGGVFHQISKILFDNIILKKIFLSLVFIFSWILFLLFKNNSMINFLILIFFPVFSLIISPALFQEYFDPIFFIIILLYLNNKFIFNLKSNLFIFSYFTFFLFIGIIYY